MKTSVRKLRKYSIFASLMMVAILPATFTSPTAAQPVARIQDGLWKAVVKIESFPTTSDLPPYGVGSGFIISTNIIRGSKTRRLDFLVTNKHVVGNWTLGDGDFSEYFNRIKIYYYSSNMAPTTVRLKDEAGNLRPLVMLHPEPRVDVVVIPLVNEFIAHEVDSLDANYLLSFTSNLIGIGNQVFALGYPYGITSINNDYPMAKSAFIASLPGIEFKWHTYAESRTNGSREIDVVGKYVFVDGLIVGGNSGGPVILPSDFKVWVENGALKWLNYHQFNYVIGLVSQTGPSGLSMVYSTDYILELVSSFEKHIASIEDYGFKLK